jgi:hypothetical protein
MDETSSGRVYDPELGRFMSADPFVQAPYNSQSYNRYSYVFNNPLSFTDPTGYATEATKYDFQENGCPPINGADCAAKPPSNSCPSNASCLTGDDAYQYWQSQINQSLESLVGGAFNFTGIPTIFNAVIEVDIAMNMGDYSAIKPIVVMAAVEFGTKKVEKVPGLAKVAEAVETKVEKALGKGKTHEHHSDPKFLGGNPKQKLTKLDEKEHRQLHKDMNSFLRTKTNENGDHMRPQRGNSGRDIQENFTRDECLAALCEFYRGVGAKYENAAKDFFDQHSGI